MLWKLHKNTVFKILDYQKKFDSNRFSKATPMQNVWDQKMRLCSFKLIFFYIWQIITQTHYEQFKTIRKKFYCGIS